MNKKYNKEEILGLINKSIKALDINFTNKSYKKMYTLDQVYAIFQELDKLFKIYYDIETFNCCRKVINEYIPLLNLIIKLDTHINRRVKYNELLKNAYRMGARISLEHFMIYYDWENKTKFYEDRVDILEGAVYYLNSMAYNRKIKLLIINMPSGWGKKIADYVPVLTRKGWKKHGDLVVGDEVLSPNGNFVKVLKVHPKDMINQRMIFDDGEQIDCHKEHLWLVYDRHKNSNRIVDTQYIANNLKEKNGRTRFYIPIKEYVKGEEKKLPVDPYTYGLWLGDGSNMQPRICACENDIETINSIPYEISSINIHKKTGVISNTYKNLRKDLQKLNLCYNKNKTEKYINDMYLTSSIQQRLELLAGLIDSDGYLDKEKQRYIFTTTSEKLKDGIITLINSFGWRTSITKIQPKKSTSGIIGKKVIYDIGFSPDCEIPCRLERKKITKLHKKRRIGIKKIETIEPTQGNCISVEGKLYLVGKTLKTTHNTRTVKMYEGWRLGFDPTGTFLSLARSDRLLKQGSSSVIEIIKSEQFREIFPCLDWKKDKDLFLKDSVEDWKLKHCKLGATYITGTRDGGITGLRCSFSTHIDDMYDDEYEAQSKDLNDRVYTKYQMVWTERTTKGIEPQIIITMTKWSVDDLVSRIINDAREKHTFKKDKFPFTEISEDGSVVIITIPALNDLDESTCPNLNSTEYLHNKRSKISTASWLTNFQQQATPQEGLEFDWDKLETYQSVPIMEDNFCKASLDPPRKGKDYLSMPIFCRQGDKWALKDILFVQKTPKECIEEICYKIIENNIIALVLENNTDTSLGAYIKQKLKELGHNPNLIAIYEKFNVKKKETRINDVKDTIKANIIFPCKEMYGINTQMGKAMDMLVRFSFLFPNKFDDFPDSVAMFVQEIVLGGSIPQKAKAVKKIG